MSSVFYAIMRGLIGFGGSEFDKFFYGEECYEF